MQVTRATFIPLLAPAGERMEPGTLRDSFCGDLSVVYTFGPQFGRRVVTHTDLQQMGMPPRVLRRSALDHLEVLTSRAQFHGQPPALMLSFEGLESSVLLANDFWNRLQGAVPGELVVGVPARDVVIVTGSRSGPGMEKVRRAIDRVFFAGDNNLLTRMLLVRRGGGWELFDSPMQAPMMAGARPGPGMRGPVNRHGPGQQPRQYQEHPSWPSERVPVSTNRSGLLDTNIGRLPTAAAAPAATGPGGSPFPVGYVPGSTYVPPAAAPQFPPPPEPGFTGITPLIAPMSAMPAPMSPMPAPMSAMPNSPMPVPFSAVPYSPGGQPSGPDGYAQRRPGPGPMNREPRRDNGNSAYADMDDAISQYANLREGDSPAPSPEYPAMWGSAPDDTNIRSAQGGGRLSPRARFSR